MPEAVPLQSLGNWVFPHWTLEVPALDALELIDPEKGLMRGFFLHWTHLTTALHLPGEHRRELNEARRGLEAYPGNPFMQVNVARALPALGRSDEARSVAGDRLVRIAAALGERELAVAKLWHAFDQGYPCSDIILRDEDLYELHGHEPFEELIRPKR